MEICEKTKCTGCAACANICPVSAIIMQADDHGFLHPVIDAEKCIACHKCQNNCPQNDTAKVYNEGKIFAALAKNDDLREKSSSGGIFSLLAQRTLKKGGIVYGAAYDDDLIVKHIPVTDTADLAKLRGSKYVQSQIGLTFREVKEHLDTGKSVLYSGTPCQIAGLNAYLGKSYDNLLTVDILCHGTPSPKVFRSFVDSLQKQYNNKIIDVRFRDKNPGWKKYSTQIVFEDKKTVTLHNNPYMRGFLTNVYLRNCCSQCAYASAKRTGDITLGDFWKYKESSPQFIMDDDRGISLVILNSPKGEKAFKKIRRYIASAPRTIEDAYPGNPILTHPSSASENSSKFWECFNVKSWQDICNDYPLEMPEFHDYLTPEDRAYFAQPFTKRYPMYVIRSYKNLILEKIRRK